MDGERNYIYARQLSNVGRAKDPRACLFLDISDIGSTVTGRETTGVSTAMSLWCVGPGLGGASEAEGADWRDTTWAGGPE